jgi:L-ascorbate metabolism protein UlaG (beta-lactamase superfamily)
LIFDYFEGNRGKENKFLSNGFIDPMEIKNEKLFVFISHRHQDHFDRVILNWREVIENINYFAGWNARSNGFIPIPPHSSVETDAIKISTLTSTDEGVGFLVKIDGLTIFHAGDHANWDDNTPGVSYHDEIDYISKDLRGIDIAFIPVTKFSGIRPKCMTEGALYAAEKLNPRVIFPMHGNNREYLYREFASEEGAQSYNIVCAEKRGDMFKYAGGKII